MCVCVLWARAWVGVSIATVPECKRIKVFTKSVRTHKLKIMSETSFFKIKMYVLIIRFAVVMLFTLNLLC